MQMNKETHIIHVPVGGLANRMKAIGAAVALSNDVQATTTIIWYKDKGLNCPFDELFEPIENKLVTLRENSIFDLFLYDRPRKKNFCIPRFFQKFLFDQAMYEQDVCTRSHEGFDFLSWCLGKKSYIAGYVYFYPKENNKFSIFHPKAELMERIRETVKLFGKQTIGVHIRRTDNIESIQKSPTHLFIERMKAEVEKNPDTKFYLATDSDEEKNTMKEIFKERIITSPKQADRNSPQGIKDALVEMYVLSMTSKIFGSVKSSFSQTAAEIGGITCEFIKQ